MGAERRLQRRISKELDKSGWLVLKLGVVSIAGFPDLLAMKAPGRISFIEVKAPGQEPRKLQMYWLRRLHAMGFDSRWCDSIDGIEDLV